MKVNVGEQVTSLDLTLPEMNYQNIEYNATHQSNRNRWSTLLELD